MNNKNHLFFFFFALALLFAPQVHSEKEEDLIRIPVVVTDKKGRFVEGLGRKDFILYESGKKQKIVECSIREMMDGRALIKRENGESEKISQEFFIIFDPSSIDPFSLQKIRAPLNDFLQEHFHEEDNITFFLDNKILAWRGKRLIHVGQSILPLEDTDLQHQIIAEMMTNLRKIAIEKSVSPEKFQDIPETPDVPWHPMRNPVESSPGFDTDYRRFTAFGLMDRLRSIAVSAEKMKGEKTALFISETPQQAGPSRSTEKLRGPTSYITGGFFRGKSIETGKKYPLGVPPSSSLAELFCHSQITFYSLLSESARLDVPHLDSTDMFNNTLWEDAASKANPWTTQGLPEFGPGAEGAYSLNTIRRLSEDTGGIALASIRDLSDSFQKIGEAMQRSYVLLYDPTDKNKDGKFRKVKIKVNRKGVRIRHRKGYYAIDREGEERKELEYSLNKGASSEELRISIRAQAYPLSEHTHYLIAKVEIQGLSLNDIIEERGGMYESSLSGQARIYLLLEEDRGKTRDREDKSFDFKISRGELRNKPAIYFGRELQEGNYRIRVAVKDKLSGEVSTSEKAIEIRSAGMESEEEGVLHHFQFVKKDVLTRELNEIRGVQVHEEGKIYPRLSAEFRSGEDLHFYFEMSSEDKKGLDLYFQIITEDSLLFRAYQMSSAAKGDRTPFLINIPLKDFSPGEYVLQITAIEREKRKHHILRKNFRLK